MNSPVQNIYEFANFRFDAARLVLYFEGVLVKDVNQKTLQVLAVLLSGDDRIATYDEIIDRVWPGSSQGVDSLSVNQYVAKLRKVFSTHDPDVQFIENIKGRGYRFLGPAQEHATATAKPGSSDRARDSGSAGGSATRLRGLSQHTKMWLFSVPVAAVLVIALGIWIWLPNDEEESVRRTVKESQIFESLVLYRDPGMVHEQDLKRFWLADSDETPNHDWKRIRDSVERMQKEGLRYGDGTKLEQFDFQSIEIDKNRALARVRTLEKWFIAIYGSDGNPQKNKTVGPYFVDYILRQVDGKWLIDKSTTARVTRPVPRLNDLEILTQPTSGQEFIVGISGSDIEPQTIYLKVVGPGCPDSKPCKIPNSVLLEKAKLTTVQLTNVPLTLTSGSFQISAHNGDSPASNFVYVQVP